MSISTSAVPTPDETRRQLERMLASDRFVVATNQADFLALVVKRALEGKKTTEDIIGRTLFGAKFEKDESTDVRVTASNLRKKLRTYYAQEGREDLVIIALREPPRDKTIKLPEGVAYQPLFSYNPRHPHSRKFRLGIHYLAQKSPEAISQALAYLQDVGMTQESHAPARIALVEALCATSLYLGSVPPEELLALARQIANDAMQLNPNDWHAHASHGAALLCSWSLDQAGIEFDTALRLDKIQTLNYVWYAAYLFTVGKREQALELVKLSAAEQVESPQAHAAYGIYLYALRRFDEAELVLNNALKLDPNYWVARLVLSALYLSLDRPDDALRHYDRVQVLTDADGAWVMPGLAALCASRATKITKRKRSLMCRWAKELLVNIDASVDWFQCALACLGFQETDNVFLALDDAYITRHPLLLWLDVWPIFDPLRQTPEFQALVNRINLPHPVTEP